MKYMIKTDGSKEQISLVVNLLVFSGYRLTTYFDNVEKFIAACVPNFPDIVITNKEVSGFKRGNELGHEVVTLGEYIDREIITKPVVVKLNDEHSAIVSKTGIKVGCQNFPLSIVKALSEAVDSLNS